MRQAHSRRASMLALLLAVPATLLLVGRSADAKDCGGAIACGCGDRVIADVTLPQSLNNCLDDGLVIAAGTLDCQGRQIAGPGDQTSTVGIKIAGFNGTGASGAQVRNCRVRNFGRGIEIDSGSGNTLENNVSFNNEIGIWLGDGTSGNVLHNNHVRDNRDEGIHVGGATHHNQLTGNSLVNNSHENLYLIDTASNVVEDNSFSESGSAAIHLKNAVGNTITDNTILDRSVVVRGGSTDNVFDGNELDGNFRFQANEDNGVWSYPHDNHVIGGTMYKASTCFEFDGAYDNTASDVEVDTCRAFEEKEYGGLTPHGNDIQLIRIDVGNPRHSGERRSASLRLSADPASTDRFRIDLRGLEPDTSLDPLHEEVHCSLSDFHGTILDFLLPAGSITQSGRQLRYVDPQGSIGGLRRLELREQTDGRWRIKMSGKAQIVTANYPLMTISCQVGDDTFTFNDYWDELSRGWNLRVQP